MWVSPKGGLYFTGPHYERDYWTDQNRPPIGQCVYYLAPGAAQPTAVETTLRKPNGLIGPPDGRTL
ncbi:hypothetical protein QMK33_14500 [Hymenobacter sp. H14-R3]|uniref:hypothetical protein n=1 Tax=Hymenobacter sp. H14-R3 TaxID=3046308 RepID=UPI0024BBAFE1|nr:hypothetical protein [Hymenobacter sp. H14-R3]MDJ0366367.1 hypothetical protein [Hymenobacter sp. H14-R3]